MQEDLDLALKRISELERRLEKYYQLLHIDNELDFVLNGTYIAPVEIENIVDGTYEMAGSTETGETEDITDTNTATATNKSSETVEIEN